MIYHKESYWKAKTLTSVMYYMWQIHTCNLLLQPEGLLLSSARNIVVGGEVTGGTDVSFSHDFLCDLTSHLSLTISLLDCWIPLSCV